MLQLGEYKGSVATPGQEQRAVVRLLHRGAFGPKPDQFADALAMGSERTKQLLLSSVNATNAAKDAKRSPLPELQIVDGTDRAAARQEMRRQVFEIQLWWLERMVTSSQPLVERMTWFLHGHWATSALKVKDARLMLTQNQTLRSTAFANFGDQAKLMLKDPAMLVWLDGIGSRVGHPNENLGREFLELFALGVGNYTENDVKEASRALTGWSVNYQTVTSLLRTRNFDAGSKTVLGTTANFTVDSLVDHIVSQPSCAEFLAKRIWFRMISSEKQASTAPLVSALGANRNLLNLMDASLTQLIQQTSAPLAKTPVDWAVGVMKALDISPSAMKSYQQGKLLDYLNAMGQVPFIPPSVGGWPSGQAWFSATATQARIDLSQLLVSQANLKWLRGVPNVMRPNVLAQRLGVAAWSPTTAGALVSSSNSVNDAFVLAINSPDYLVVS